MWQWRWKLQSDASCRPRDAKDAGKCQKLGEKHGRDAPQNLWGRNQLCRHLDFRLLASRPVKEKISVSLSHQVCGSVLQKLQDTNTQALHNAWSGLQWVSEECHTDGQRAAGEKSIARGVNHPQDTDPQLLREGSAWQCRKHKRCGLDNGLGRSLGVGNGSPLKYSCLENSMDEEPGRL